MYGTVNLKDGNGDYKNTHIGSSIVTTGSYNTLVANLTSQSTITNTFEVDLKLQGDDVSREGLTSVNLMLYEGSGDINSGEYENWSRTITEKNFTSCLGNIKETNQVNSLQEMLFDNTLVVTPSFIGGGKESNYTETNYQVVVTATIDGTTYSNKIPIEVANDGNENTGNTTYTDEKINEQYSAAYIIVKGKGTTEEVTDDLKKLSATAITNADASKYGITKNNELDDSTYVGYYVNTTFANTGSLPAKKITYYVWDSEGNPVLDEEKKQMTKTLDINNQEKMPSAVFELRQGTIDTVEEDNKSGLHRGDGYFFSYTITYLDTEGKELIWPTCKSNDKVKYDNKSLKTDMLFPKKQEPKFAMYPKTSDDTTITYKYACKDYDKALYYEAHSTTEYAYLSLIANGTVQNSSIEIMTDGTIREINIGKLSTNTVYKIGYVRNLNKAQTTTYKLQNLVSQKFEGIVSCNEVEISNIIYNDNNNPNNVIIKLTGNSISRIAAVKVTFSNGQETVTTGFLDLVEDNGTCIKVDLLEVFNNENLNKFIGKDVNISVTAYYDNGRVGFIPENGSTYATYTDENNSYLKFEGGKFLRDNDEINGKLFEYRFYPSDDNAQLGIKDIEKINNNLNGSTVELQYSSSGLIQNDNVIVQKEIAETQIDENIEHKINIKNIRIGLKINDIKTTLSSATVNAALYNPLGVSINDLTIEMWHSKDKNEKPNWDECETRTINVDEISEFKLDDLLPAEYYYIRFKYMEGSNYLYTYDKDTKEIKTEYKFETLATIGITDIKVEYSADNYVNKFLNISYNVNNQRSNMFEKIKYAFYKKDGVTQINLIDQNIKKTSENAEYSIEEGALIVTNPSYPDGQLFQKVTEQIAISPKDNIFTMDDEYVLKISPIVTINKSICEIEEMQCSFKLNKLNEPQIGLKMERKKLTTDINYIRIPISINDKDAMIYGSEWGEYSLHVYKYKDSIDNALEVDLYDDYQDGINVTGNTFNLQEHSTNFSVFIQEKDIDYSYNYIAKIELKYDRDNNGNNLETNTKQYILKAISNDADVAIGSATLVQNGKYCEIRFYESYYNIENIDRIEYSIFNLASNNNITNSFVPEWTSENEDKNVIYFKTRLPTEFNEVARYTIKMNLYSNSVLVGQIDTTYNHE